MSIKQIEQRRNVSKAKASGPWRDWPEEMMLKTVLRNGLKVVPMSPEIATALHADDAADTGAPQSFDREALPAPPQRKGDPLLGTDQPIEGEVIEDSDDLQYDDGSPEGAFMQRKE